jgi:uncharacterized protein (DUF2141 family)
MALTYTASITGDCSNTNSGIIELFPLSGVSPYTVDWYSPSITTETGVTTSSIVSGLSAGTYSILITDSTSPTNQTLYVNIVVSSGVCISSVSVTDTTCNNDDGTLSITTSSPYSPLNYYLYCITGVTNFLVTSATTVSVPQVFYGLSAGTYYVVVEDGGGCTGSTGTQIVGSSSNLDYGFYVVGNSSCITGYTGAIYITGLTGTSPFYYTWSTGAITSSISGLSAGTYYVSVTDSSNCTLTKSVDVTTADLLGIVNFVNVAPTCFNYDGEITVNISGGTPPYYYQFSTGQNDVIFGNTITYTGLPAGTYSVIVTDAAFCVTSGVTTITTVGSFDSLSIAITNSLCGTFGGNISILTSGGFLPITFSLTDSTSATTTYIGGPNYTFNGLSAGTYTLNITNGGTCTYTDTIEIFDESPFNVITTTTGTTCGLQNGVVFVTIDTPGTYTYQLGSVIVSNTTNTSVLFTGLTSGVYTLTVSDTDPESLPCIQTTTVLITSSNGVDFAIQSSTCGSGSEGTITLSITNGEPPFTYNWTPSVGPQTGIYITGLTAGTYTVDVFDSNGCKLTKTTTITCPELSTSYQSFNICDGTFTEEYGTILGLQEMLYDGFAQLTSNDLGCVLSSATYIIQIEVSGNTYEGWSATTYSITGTPTVSEYISALTDLLYTIPGINEVTIDENTNSIKIGTDCDKELADYDIQINMKIDYEICCNIVN